MCMIAFGWAYPHFLRGDAFALLVAAPLGVIPCPTLAAVIGVALIADGLGARAWSWTLAATGVFYAVFGVARLGVWIDVALLVGSVALMARAARAWPPLEHQAASSIR
jgi:hypothetical protein